MKGAVRTVRATRYLNNNLFNIHSYLSRYCSPLTSCIHGKRNYSKKPDSEQPSGCNSESSGIFERKNFKKNNAEAIGDLQIPRPRQPPSIKKYKLPLNTVNIPDDRNYELEDPEELPRHDYWKSRSERAVNRGFIHRDVQMFEQLTNKNKETFTTAVELFHKKDVQHRGHVEFIYAALQQMKLFGVHRDLDAYKKILDCFPKGLMIATNMFQVEFMHYPKQQQCAIDLLEQMEEFNVIPDQETQEMITAVFGSRSFPMRKSMRMLYWMPKFKNLSPWPLPDPLPDNSIQQAVLAIKRITSVDLETNVSVLNTENLEDAVDMTWIVSGQSSKQKELIRTHPSDRPIYVEGAFRVWLQRSCINYFILRSEPRQPKKSAVSYDPDDVSNVGEYFDEDFVDKRLSHVPSVHEQEDGVIFAVCATGTSSRDSIVSWIKFLEKENPRLSQDISIIFSLKSPIGPTDDLELLTDTELEDQAGLHHAVVKSLGLDPKNPDLKQVGVWRLSDSKFPNWPHDHNPKTLAIKKQLEQLQSGEQKEKTLSVHLSSERRNLADSNDKRLDDENKSSNQRGNLMTSKS